MSRNTASFFFFNDTATTEIYTFPTRRSSDLCPGAVRRDARRRGGRACRCGRPPRRDASPGARRRRECDARARSHPSRSEEHTSELQSRLHLVCRLLLEKKKTHVLPATRDSCR